MPSSNEYSVCTFKWMNRGCMLQITPKRWFLWLLGCGLLCLWLTKSLAAGVEWRQLSPGIDYTDIPIKQALGDGKLHAFRIDVTQHEPELILASTLNEQALYVKQYAQLTQSVFAINGGFFDTNKKPLGLRINGAEMQNPLRDISWWGVFYIANHIPYIVSRHQFHPHPSIKMALQAGPRLIINRDIPKLKAGFDNRSALCINSKRELIFFITEHAPMQTTVLAERLLAPEAKGGFECVNALNLDGGTSSQLFAKIGNFQLSLSNLFPVADAIVIKKPNDKI